MYQCFRLKRHQLLTTLLALVPLPCVAAAPQAAVGAKSVSNVTKSPTTTAKMPSAGSKSPPEVAANAIQSVSVWQTAKTAGDAAFLRGNLPDAEAKYRAAVASAEKLPDNMAVLSCLTALSNCLAAQPNKISDEEPLRQRAVELSEKTFGATSSQLALSIAQLADLQARKGESGLAEENTDRAIKMLNQSEDKYPLEMATCFQAMAQRQVATHSLGLADDSFKKAFDLRSANLPANDLVLLHTCRCYADLLIQLGRKDEAEKLRDRIVLARSEAPGDNSTTTAPAAKSDKSKSRQLAQLISDAKEASKSSDQARAVTSWKAVVAEAEKSGAKDGQLPFALVHLGGAYHAQGNTDEAAALYRRAMDIREQEGKTRSLGMVRNVSRLASIEMQKKNAVEASRLYIKALAVEDDSNAPDAIVADTLQKMISTCMMVKDNGHAEQAAKRLIPLAEKIGGPFGDLQKGMAIAMLGSLYMKAGRMSDGMQLMKSMPHMARPNQAEFAETMQENYASDEALYDKSEEAAFLN